MTIARIRAAVAVLAVLTLATTAQAGWLNATLRELGWAWSDGYHARSTSSPPVNSFGAPAGHAPQMELLPSATPTPAKFGIVPARIVPPSRMARPTAPPGSFR